MLKSLEINQNQNRELIEYCNNKKIIFLSTPFDEDSIDELLELDLPAFKVASTDTTNLPFLKKLALTGKPLFLSTGMSYFAEIEMALEEIYPHNKNIVLLQCTANYPIEDNEANLNVINQYRSHFDVLVGYSDHSVGLGAALYSIPMGARVVEKHFTLDTGEKGPDHKASLTPNELIEFVKEVRKVENYMGNSIKKPSLAEIKTRNSLQKCLVAKKKILKGEMITLDNIVAKRTGGKGISPLYYKDLLNKASSNNYNINDIIEE